MSRRLEPLREPPQLGVRESGGNNLIFRGPAFDRGRDLPPRIDPTQKPSTTLYLLEY